MSTQISTIDKSYVKMRWKEDYVTAGLNRKMLGAVPSGLVRGGLMSPGGSQTVDVEPDPKYGDIVAAYGDETNGFQTTVRLTGAQNLDLSSLSGQTVYVCLFVDYTQGAETAAEWRAYTQAELDGAAEKDSLVILGKVTVSSPIAADDIEYSERTEQGMKLADSQVPWVPMLPNGNFDAGFDGWEYISGNINGFGFEASSPYRGIRSLKVVNTIIDNCLIMFQGRIPVQPGDLVKIHAAFKGTGSAGTSSVKLLLFTDSGTQSAILPIGLEFDESSGTSWEMKEGVFKIPDTVYFVDVIVQHDAGSTVGACIDDVQVYLKSADQAGAPIMAQDAPARPVRRCGTLELDYKDPITSLSSAERFRLDGQSTAGRVKVSYSGAVSPASIEPAASGAVDLGRSTRRWGEAFAEKLNVSAAAGDGVSADLVPSADDSYDLGNSSYKWANLFCTTITPGSSDGEGFAADVKPTVSGSYDLGSSARRWEEGYINKLTLGLGVGDGIATDVLPSTGSLTIGHSSYPWGEIYANQVIAGKVLVNDDISGGGAGTVVLTNVSSTAGSTPGSVNTSGGAASSGWIKIYVNGAARYIPVFSTT